MKSLSTQGEIIVQVISSCDISTKSRNQCHNWWSDLGGMWCDVQSLEGELTRQMLSAAEQHFSTSRYANLRKFNMGGAIKRSREILNVNVKTMALKKISYVPGGIARFSPLYRRWFGRWRSFKATELPRLGRWVREDIRIIWLLCEDEKTIFIDLKNFIRKILTSGIRRQHLMQAPPGYEIKRSDKRYFQFPLRHIWRRQRLPLYAGRFVNIFIDCRRL